MRLTIGNPVLCDAVGEHLLHNSLGFVAHYYGIACEHRQSGDSCSQWIQSYRTEAFFRKGFWCVMIRKRRSAGRVVMILDGCDRGRGGHDAIGGGARDREKEGRIALWYRCG